MKLCSHCLCFHPQSQAYEFQFGLEYAWTMCIFAVSMTYSITCPIITPFGEQHTAQRFPFILICLFLLSTFSLSPPPHHLPSLSCVCVCVCVCVSLTLRPHSPLLPASPMQTVWICCCSPRHPDTVSCEPDAHSAPVSAQRAQKASIYFSSQILKALFIHNTPLFCAF